MSDQDPYFAGPAVPPAPTPPLPPVIADGQPYAPFEAPPPMRPGYLPPRPAGTAPVPAPQSTYRSGSSTTLRVVFALAAIGFIGGMTAFVVILNTGAKQAVRSVDKAFDLQARLTLDQLVRAEEVYRAQNDTYVGLSELQAAAGFTIPPRVTVTIVGVTPTRYCASARYAASSTTWYFDSVDGSMAPNQPCS